MYVLTSMVKETRRDLTASRFGSAMVLETSGTSRPATWRDKPRDLNLLLTKYYNRNNWRS